jgi:sulfur-carrier protein
MSITVRFFAGLRERMGRDQDILDSKGIRGVTDVWNHVAPIRQPGNTLVALNMEYLRPDQGTVARGSAG